MSSQFQLIGVLSTLKHSTRKGAVTVLVAVLMVVLLGCAAMAVDIGHLYVARTELQRAADAAALAGALALGRTSDDAPYGDYYRDSEDIYSQAEKYALANKVVGHGVVVNRASDIKIGYLQYPRDLSASLQVVPLDACNAVQVIARRDSTSPDGRVRLFFAPIWGINSSNVSASAVAVLDDRFYGFAPQVGIPNCVMPLAVDEARWNDEVVNGNGQDGYSYDNATGNIVVSPDGDPEIKLFPEQLGPSEDNENDGAGNFGILHVGAGSLGTSTIVEQITNGITGDDLIDMTGEPMIKFYSQDSGQPLVYNAVSYDILGDPGVKVGMENALEAKIGQVVGFFLYSNVAQTGSNTIFDVVGMRFGRVMAVDFSGSVNSKAIFIQPAPYSGSDILTSPYTPSTNYTISRIELVR